MQLKELFDGVTLKRGRRARAELEAQLLDAARELDEERLRIAIRQLQALAPAEPLVGALGRRPGARRREPRACEIRLRPSARPAR